MPERPDREHPDQEGDFAEGEETLTPDEREGDFAEGQEGEHADHQREGSFAEGVGRVSADRLCFQFIEIGDLPPLPEAFTAIC